MAFTNITLEATFHNDDGTPASGSITLVLSDAITNSDVTLGTDPRELTLDAAGSISATVMANDDAGTLPAGTFYTVIEHIYGASYREYVIVVPHASPGGVLHLSDAMPSGPTAVD